MSYPSVPLNIHRRRDNGTVVTYQRNEELGHGGFAHVYKITNTSTNEVFALKAIPKTKVAKPKVLSKLKAEIAIQKSLNHPNILKSYDSFEDLSYFYIILEYCPYKSVKDLLYDKKRFSEDEAMSILKEVIGGLTYLHDNQIIHRDLKLENFLFGKDEKIKIADFGLSTRIYYPDERKFSVCGTPNYLSPELVSPSTNGHSYEVDIWAIGVSCFTLLTGHPPFESTKKNITFNNIKNCNYRFPLDVRMSQTAKDFIKGILQIDPMKRPTAIELSTHILIRTAKPTSLVLKRFFQQQTTPAKGIAIANENVNENIAPTRPPLFFNYGNINQPQPLQIINNNVIAKDKMKAGAKGGSQLIPRSFVSRFCDNSERIGLGYLLIDGTIGVVFHDGSRMAMDPHETFIQYWEEPNQMLPVLADDSSDDDLRGKVSHLKLYALSLKKTQTMFELPTRKYNRNVPLKHVKSYIKSSKATLFKFDDKNIQVNFDDHQKLFIFSQLKKLFLIRNIKESPNIVKFNDINDQNNEEYRRFCTAKKLLGSFK